MTKSVDCDAEKEYQEAIYDNAVVNSILLRSICDVLISKCVITLAEIDKAVTDGRYVEAVNAAVHVADLSSAMSANVQSKMGC